MVGDTENLQSGEKEKQKADIQNLAWHSQVVHANLLLNINHLTEYQPHNLTPRSEGETKQANFITLSKHKEKITVVTHQNT